MLCQPLFIAPSPKSDSCIFHLIRVGSHFDLLPQTRAFPAQPFPCLAGIQLPEGTFPAAISHTGMLSGQFAEEAALGRCLPGTGRVAARG